MKDGSPIAVWKPTRSQEGGGRASEDRAGAAAPRARVARAAGEIVGQEEQAMEAAVCADGRARGMFQFYGANRSGRWSGRIIQLQNLPQNQLPDSRRARAPARRGF
jgi:hypothetical protein